MATDGLNALFECRCNLVLPGTDRQVQGAVLTVRDIEHRVTRERELQQAKVDALVAQRSERTKDMFLANMSHELRTPLNAIVGYSEMMLEEARADGRDTDTADLERIQAAGKHLNHIIGEILDLSKIEAGKMQLHLEPCDVAALVRELVETFRPSVRAKGLELRLELAADLPSVNADPTRVRQCLYNLLSNAVKFTEDGAIRVHIEVDGELSLCVSDTGIGIAADDLERLFTEFTQAEQSTTKRFGGTGLGLALSRRLCRMMGGDLVGQSTVGEGSRFTMMLPLGLVDLPEFEPTGSGPNVLVIDDDYETHHLLSRMLGAEGFNVVCAADGPTGLELAASLRPDAIVLDVMMPLMDGWEVLGRLKAHAQLHKTPVVLHTLVDDRAKGFALGADEYLSKPIERRHLTAVLDRLCTPGGHVLVVEDNEEVRRLLDRQLTQAGWTFTEASNGQEALTTLDGLAPDIVLLDLMMPVMDGFEFLQHLRAHPVHSELPVVVLTARDLDPQERLEIERSVHRVVHKGSMRPEDLVKELRARLNRR